MSILSILFILGLDIEKQQRMTPPNLSETSPIQSAADGAFNDEKYAESYSGKGMSGEHDYSAPDTLFIGNLPFDTNEHVISEAFSKYGTVVNARIPRDM